MLVLLYQTGTPCSRSTSASLAVNARSALECDRKTSSGTGTDELGNPQAWLRIASAIGSTLGDSVSVSFSSNHGMRRTNPRDLRSGKMLEGADDHGDKPVAVVLRPKRVFHVALHVRRTDGGGREQDHHGFGLFQSARDLARPVVAGKVLAVGIGHFQTAVRKRLADAPGKGGIVVCVAQKDLHGPGNVARARQAVTGGRGPGLRSHHGRTRMLYTVATTRVGPDRLRRNELGSFAGLERARASRKELDHET